MGDMEPLTREILREELKAFKDAIDTSMDDKLRIQADILRQEIKASAKQTKDEVIEAVAEMLDTSLVPQLDNHERRLIKLETKTA